jgi:hypothetical protein
MNVPRRIPLPAALLLALAACRPYSTVDPSGLEKPGSPGTCRQPGGEFGAGGCAVVRGRVVGARGQPLPGAGLSGGISAREGCGACNSPGIVIDSLGRSGETVHWLSTDVPDTAVATVRVAATGARYPWAGDRPAYADSARVVLRFAPTGQPAEPAAEFVLRLPVPVSGARPLPRESTTAPAPATGVAPPPGAPPALPASDRAARREGLAVALALTLAAIAIAGVGDAGPPVTDDVLGPHRLPWPAS